MNASTLVRTVLVAMLFAGLVAGLTPAWGGTGTQPGVEVEKPATLGTAMTITADDLEAVVKRYVEGKSAKENWLFFWAEDYLKFRDQKLGKDLLFKMDRVNKDHFRVIGKDSHSICVMFKEKGGETYDLDLTIQGATREALQVTAVDIHRDGHLDRYTWTEQKGIWSKSSPVIHEEKGTMPPADKGRTPSPEQQGTK
ncbi:MAG: hypothetical protein HYU36_10500 [Planctomycetes bacterium]|nr:hypothetical protein [Planctomycetota bacterium]